MLNWIKKLFGINDAQTLPETQNTVTITEIPVANAAHMVTPVVAEPVAEPVIVPEPVAVVASMNNAAASIDPVTQSRGGNNHGLHV